MDAVSPDVDVVHPPDRSRPAKARCSPCRVWVSRAITGADRPAELPRNWPSAGPKSEVDSPCRYSSGSTSVTFGLLRHQAGRIAEANRARSPVAGSTRLSFTLPTGVGAPILLENQKITGRVRPLLAGQPLRLAIHRFQALLARRPARGVRHGAGPAGRAVGLGRLPDQYDRRFDGDTGDTANSRLNRVRRCRTCRCCWAVGTAVATTQAPLRPGVGSRRTA